MSRLRFRMVLGKGRIEFSIDMVVMRSTSAPFSERYRLGVLVENPLKDASFDSFLPDVQPSFFIEPGETKLGHELDVVFIDSSGTLFDVMDANASGLLTRDVTERSAEFVEEVGPCDGPGRNHRLSIWVPSRVFIQLLLGPSESTSFLHVGEDESDLGLVIPITEGEGESALVNELIETFRSAIEFLRLVDLRR